MVSSGQPMARRLAMYCWKSGVSTWSQLNWPAGTEAVVAADRVSTRTGRAGASAETSAGAATGTLGALGRRIIAVASAQLISTETTDSLLIRINVSLPYNV